MAHPQRAVGSLRDLERAPESEQREKGYFHTLREILQQPDTWPETARTADESGIVLPEDEPVLLTGSGSSFYVGQSLEPLLGRNREGRVRAVPAGWLLTGGESYVPRGRGTLVSFARSGESPESWGAVDWVLQNRPDWRHVIITCNPGGALAARSRERRSASLLILPERTHDRSLVMTSSFTNLWLAGFLLGGGAADVDSLASAATSLLQDSGDLLAGIGSAEIASSVFLGTGAGYGAAREGALKMLEMTGGLVPAFAETFLGLRHGPMCAVRESTLLVAFLSRGERERRYERDLLEELRDKELGARILRVGLGGEISHELDGEEAVLLQVVSAQLLGLFRSLALGLRPDAPSEKGVITRVVRRFAIH